MGSLNWGGTEVLLLDTLRNAKAYGIDPILIYRKSGNFEREFQELTIPVYRCLPRSRLDISYLLRLRRLFIKENCKVIHAQQSIDALYAYLALLGLPVKVVLTFHGYDFGLTQLSKTLIRFIVRRIDCIIYVSAAQQTYYMEKYRLGLPKCQKIVHNGIDFFKFNKPTQSKVRSELGFNEHIVLLGSVGNFVAVRDQLTICRFLKKLANTGLDFRFLFVGGPAADEAYLYETCIAYCQEHSLTKHVYFLGVRSDVSAILDELDAFIYATNHDTFGIAVVEALATGTPVFVNDWTVMREVTEEGRFGILYKTKDTEDLLVKFQSFLANQNEYLEKSREDAKAVQNKYGISNHLSLLRNIYLKLSNSGD